MWSGRYCAEGLNTRPQSKDGYPHRHMELYEGGGRGDTGRMCERMSVQSVGDSCRHGENPCLAACAVLCGVVRHTELYVVGGGHGRMCERIGVCRVWDCGRFMSSR